MKHETFLTGRSGTAMFAIGESGDLVLTAESGCCLRST